LDEGDMSAGEYHGRLTEIAWLKNPRMKEKGIYLK